MENWSFIPFSSLLKVTSINKCVSVFWMNLPWTPEIVDVDLATGRSQNQASRSLPVSQQQTWSVSEWPGIRILTVCSQNSCKCCGSVHNRVSSLTKVITSTKSNWYARNSFSDKYWKLQWPTLRKLVFILQAINRHCYKPCRFIIPA